MAIIVSLEHLLNVVFANKSHLVFQFFFFFFLGGGGVNKRLRKQPRSQTKILHSTHSAWSERKGQWPRVLCATSPWEPRLLDHGSPVQCKFEEQRARKARLLYPWMTVNLAEYNHSKPFAANEMFETRVCDSVPRLL